MTPNCITAVNSAVGRELTAAEIKAVEEGLRRNLHMLARSDPQAFHGMTDTQRMTQAAQGALAEFMGEKAKKVQRAAAQVMADANILNRMQTIMDGGKSGAMSAINVMEQVQVRVKGVQREYFASLMDAIEAAEPRFLGLMENAAAVRDFVHEVFGQKTGNEIAARGAKAWLDTIEQMRTRWNGLGGNIGKLDYAYLPQPHDNIRILNAGRDAWVNAISPLLDRSRYMNDDGTVMRDADYNAMLGRMWDTISSDGLNKLEPGQFQGSALGSRHSEARQIHFKDADGYLAYMTEYGRGTAFSAMQWHVTKLARDIGLVEEMGPNPAALFRKMNDIAKQHDGGEKLAGPFLVRAVNVWDELSGYSLQTAHQRLGDISQGVRNFEVAAKLQGTLLSSISDLPTLFLTAHYNKMPIFDVFSSIIKSFGKDSANYANRVGMISDSVISDMNRWAEGNIGQGWTMRLANATQKAGLIEAWTNALRRGYSVAQMSSLAKLSREDWARLADDDRARLEAKGINEQDWNVLRAAKLDTWRGLPMLTPENVRAVPDTAIAGDAQAARNAAVAKLLGFIADESEYAVLNPDLMARASINRSTQKGTMEGEFRRNLMLFTSFPRAMITRHIRRAYEMDSRLGALGYAASLGVGLTMFGALSLIAKDMAQGKDPRDMTNPKFWGAAFAQGGGAGIWGDLMYTGMGGNERMGKPDYARLAGPVYGDLVDLGNLTLGNIGELLKGKKTDAGAEMIRFTRGHMPFVNLWYARSAIDHAFYHEMLEAAHPGYLSRMRAKAMKDTKQRYWWEPGTGLPDRAPNLEALLGQ